MAQYHPAGLAGRNQHDGYHEIDRLLARDEYELAAQFAGELGLARLDRRSRASGLAREHVPVSERPIRCWLVQDVEARAGRTRLTP